MISVVCDILSPVVLSSPYHMTYLTNQIISCSTTYKKSKIWLIFIFKIQDKLTFIFEICAISLWVYEGKKNSADIKIYRHITV